MSSGLMLLIVMETSLLDMISFARRFASKMCETRGSENPDCNKELAPEMSGIEMLCSQLMTPASPLKSVIYDGRSGDSLSFNLSLLMGMGLTSVST